MASINQLRRGLDIIAKYCDPDKMSVCADHDIIYAGGEDAANEMSRRCQMTRMTDEDKVELKKMGWHFDEDSNSWAKHV